MLKKLGLGLFCASTCFTASVFADPIYMIPIPAGQSYTVNPFLLPISGTCTIVMETDQSTKMTGRVIRPTITMDGVKYDTIGQTASRSIRNGDSFELGASFGAGVELKNEGLYDIKAMCRVKNYPTA